MGLNKNGSVDKIKHDLGWGFHRYASRNSVRFKEKWGIWMKVKSLRARRIDAKVTVVKFGNITEKNKNNYFISMPLRVRMLYMCAN